MTEQAFTTPALFAPESGLTDVHIGLGLGLTAGELNGAYCGRKPLRSVLAFPEVAFGMRKAVKPLFWATRHSVTATSISDSGSCTGR